MFGDIARNVFGIGLWLLAGYTFIHTSYFRRYRCEHLRTDRFALHLLACSFVLYVFGAFSSQAIPDWTPEWFVGYRDMALAVGVSPALINALGAALLLGVYDNLSMLRHIRRNPALQAAAPEATSWRDWVTALAGRMRLAALARFVSKSNDASLRVLFRAFILNKLLLVTLKSRKVYVGRLPWTDFDPAHPLTAINIVPFYSGFRDETTKRVTYTTNYHELHRKFLTEVPAGQQAPHSNPSSAIGSDFYRLRQSLDEATARIDILDFGVVIPVTEIESMSIHDVAVSAWFDWREANRHL